MRIRRKKNIQTRLDNVKDYLIFSDLDIPNVTEAVKHKKYIEFNKIFDNDGEVVLEIGCGKGGFVSDMAKTHPSQNFLAVELLSNIIVMAAENAKAQGLKNLIFFNCGADYLPRYIMPESISEIYLNFSPPYNGERYKNRRLTYDTLVTDYFSFLKKDGVLRLKTDDKQFFDYSFGQLKKFGFTVEDITEKVSKNEIENVLTEYEKKFLSQNMPIYYLAAKK